MNTTSPPPTRFSTPVRVRYADTDASGAVHPSAYLSFFEVARVESLRGLGVAVAEFEERGILMPVVEARLVCLQRARLDDLLQVTVTLDRRGPASFCFDYAVTRDDVLLVKGWTRIAVVERDTLRAISLPAWVRDLLDALVP